MNNIAISPHIFMYALQNQNVERKTAKQIDIKSLRLNQGKEETTSISELNTRENVETEIAANTRENGIEANTNESTNISEIDTTFVNDLATNN